MKFGAFNKLCAPAFPCISLRFLHQTKLVSIQMYHHLYHRCTKPTGSGSVSLKVALTSRIQIRDFLDVAIASH